MKRSVRLLQITGLCGLMCVPLMVQATKGEEGSVQSSLIETQAQGSAQLSTLYIPSAGSDSLVGVAPARYPALVLLHSGFSGDDANLRRMARDVAQQGVVVVVPAYRGEKRGIDGQQSEGEIEFCSGEVDDVQSVLALLRTRADVDPARMALLGMSHGGCTALRVAEREPRLRAVAVLSAPTEGVTTEQHVRHHPLHALWLGIQLWHYVGGSAEEYPRRWWARSSLFAAHKLRMPLFVAHGSDDSIIPPDEACWLTSVLQRNGRSWYTGEITAAGQPLLVPASRCELLEPYKPAREKDEPVNELWFLQGQGHLYNANVRRAIERKALDFVLRELMS